ncbi:hypothetical protein HYQ46_002274 [Verticillium longisporum]|nr:hypothetical protein HYQ46_002274 [Verticillium longisporum]
MGKQNRPSAGGDSRSTETCKDHAQRHFNRSSEEPARAGCLDCINARRVQPNPDLNALAMDLPPTQALVRKRADTDLMPPPPPTKKIKRPKKVIDEDAYTDALSQIIARDFFPGLLETETKQEYLDALESKDAAWISNAGRCLCQR